VSSDLNRLSEFFNYKGCSHGGESRENYRVWLEHRNRCHFFVSLCHFALPLAALLPLWLWLLQKEFPSLSIFLQGCFL